MELKIEITIRTPDILTAMEKFVTLADKERPMPKSTPAPAPAIAAAPVTTPAPAVAAEPAPETPKDTKRKTTVKQPKPADPLPPIERKTLDDIVMPAKEAPAASAPPELSPNEPASVDAQQRAFDEMQKLAPLPGGKPTIEYCRAALIWLSATKGLEAARAVLTGMGLAGVKELKEDRFQEFLDKLDAAAE